MATIKYDADLQHDGRSYSFTIPALQIPVCEECGEKVFTEKVDEQIKAAFRSQFGFLAADEIRESLGRINIAQKDAAERLGVAEATLSRWSTSLQIQSRAMDNLLRLFFSCPAARDFLMSRGTNGSNGSSQRVRRPESSGANGRELAHRGGKPSKKAPAIGSKRQNIWHVNVGEVTTALQRQYGGNRSWEDSAELGFISAGQDPKYSRSLRKLKIGDLVYAYLNRHGYVGVGRVVGPAQMAKDVQLKDGPLLGRRFRGNSFLSMNVDDPQRCEYVVLIEWISTVERGEAVGVFPAPRPTVCRFTDGVRLEILAERFKVDFQSK